LHLIEQGKSRANLPTLTDQVKLIFYQSKTLILKLVPLAMAIMMLIAPVHVVSDLNATYGTDISCDIRN